MRAPTRYVALPLALALAAAPAGAQRRMELGVDAGLVFGLGDQSSISLNLPGSRLRAGFFTPGSNISIEPAVGFGYDKVEGQDGIFTYDLELGALYHFQPIVVAPEGGAEPERTVVPPYVRPFIGFTGFTGGDVDDNEFSAGVGLGTKIPWRRDLAIRLEVNVGYGFDNEAARIGVLAGLSFFPR